MARETKYIQNLSKNFSDGIRHFIIETKKSIASQIRGGKIKHGIVTSSLDNKDVGTVEGAFQNLPKRIQRTLDDISKSFMEKILAMAKNNAPIDKKYIGKYNKSDKNVGELKRDIDYSITAKADRFSSQYSNIIDIERMYLKTIRSKNTKYGTFEKGMYDKQQFDFIKDYFLSSNKRKRYQLYVDKEGNLGAGAIRYSTYDRDFNFKLQDVKPFTGTTIQATGGNQELKRSGTLTKRRNGGYTIWFNPKKINKKLKFNYAAVQHDNLSYKHEQGKALFLYDSFEYYKNKFWNAIKTNTLRAFKEEFK